MKILIVHNFYQRPGGEDTVFAVERELLEAKGHTVNVLTAHNDAIRRMSGIASAAATLWNRSFSRKLRAKIRETSADVVHFHNTFPLVSPASYYAARSAGAAVVQTLHNFRLLCPSVLLYHDGKIFEPSVGRLIPWQAMRRKVYRDNLAATTVVAAMLVAHRLLGTYRREVDAYIALTDFGRDKFIEGALPGEKIHVKPHFTRPDPGAGPGGGEYAVFVGRLSPEKGINTLLEAWQSPGISTRLKILGDGPEADRVSAAAAKDSRIEWLGQRSIDDVYRTIGDAKLLVFPSECYEGLPMTIVESFAKGTPVVASNLGAMASLIADGVTGLHFRPGDPEDLTAKVRSLVENPQRLQAMRRAARAEYEAKYTAERNYEMLMEIYEHALLERRKRK